MGAARILYWGGQTTNHTGEELKKKRSSPFDLGFLIRGNPKFSWRSI